MVAYLTSCDLLNLKKKINLFRIRVSVSYDFFKLNKSIIFLYINFKIGYINKN